MSVAFTRLWLASSTSLLPPACVTSALTSHVTSHRTSKGDPCSWANIRWLSKASATASQWQNKKWFSWCTWPRNKAEDRQSGQGERKIVKRCETTIVRTRLLERESLAPGQPDCLQHQEAIPAHTYRWLFGALLKVELVWVISWPWRAPPVFRWPTLSSVAGRN